MLGILSLGVCLACISCLCCLCTAAVVAAPGLIDLRTGLLLCGRRQCDEIRRKSEEIVLSDVNKIVSDSNEKTSNASEIETCPCAVTYVLDPILQTRNIKESCGDFTKRRRSCRCPSFVDLIGDNQGSPGKVLPRS